MEKTNQSKTRLKEYGPLAHRNLLSQFDFLEKTVHEALRKEKYVISTKLVRELNRHAVEHLSETAGSYRTHKIEITNSSHKPPHAGKVAAQVRDCLAYLKQHWETKSTLHLAAYALWRLGWIHPFAEGNGRTARAVCQLIICLKQKAWLPEEGLVPKKHVRGSRTRYYAALRDADVAFEADGRVDVGSLEAYLSALLFKGVARTLMQKKI